MVPEEGWQPLGSVLDEALVDALSTWARDNSRSRDAEDYAARELVSYQTTFTWAHRRPTYCYIEITAKRPWESATYGYRILTNGRLMAAGPPQRVI